MRLLFESTPSMKLSFMKNWLIIFLCIHIFPLFGQSDIKFRRINVSEGLSEGTVNCFIQDQKGFIWIGTSNGLNRYDGYKFKIYKHDSENSTTISNNNIHALVEDERGFIWIGTSNGLNRYDPHLDQFQNYNEGEGNEFSLLNKTVKTLLIDSSQRLWIGTAWGINIFQPETNNFIQFRPDSEKENWLSHNWINRLYEDRKGNIWAGTASGLNKINFDGETARFTVYLPQSNNSQSISHHDVSDIFEDRSGNLWISTQGGGLNLMDRETEVFQHFKEDITNRYSLTRNNINKIFEDRQGRLWIGTDGGGLNLFDYPKRQFSVFQHNPEQLQSLGNNDIRTIFEDNQGNLWIGNTNGGGINFWANSGKNFQHIKTNPKERNSLSYDHVTCFWEREDGSMWIGTDGGGLNFFHKKSGRFIVFRHQPTQPNSLSSDKVLTVLEDKNGTVWMGSWGGGLSKFTPRFDNEGMPSLSANFTNYLPSSRSGSISSPNVTCVLEDHLGNIWAGHGYGLDKYNPEDETFTNFRKEGDNPNSLGDNGVWAMYEDSKGRMWVGTRDGGLNLFDHKTQSFTRYLHQSENSSSLSENYVQAIFEDSKGNIWAGTQSGGLNLLDIETGSFLHIREKDGLPSDVIASIEEDDKGHLWIGTSNGLCRYIHDLDLEQSKRFRNYTVGEGLQGAKFSRMSSLKNREGELFFGGINGFNRFFADSIKDNTFIPPIVLTDFQLFNKTVKIGEKNSPLNQSLLESSHINLKYWQSVFSLEFAALNYINPEENQYTFKLEGFDKEWREVGNERSTTYTNLGSGDYTFMLKGSNNDNIWNEDGVSLHISILPAPWLSWWAYLLYALVGIALIYIARQQIIQREKLKGDLKIKALEAQKLHEIDQVKTKFFANISHELRTPLTVILGMTQDVMDKVPDISWTQVQHKLQLVKRNGNSLLQLVNQILDLAKLESKTIQLKMVRGNIIEYINYLIASFHSYAEAKKIRFRLDDEIGHLEMDYDPDRIRDILSNLISNAVKFTPEGGEVVVGVRCEESGVRSQEGREENNPLAPSLLITIQDTGIGIPEKQLPRIFDRFYQVDDSSTRQSEGTGIGLSLTYELVNLLGGDISVKSEVGKGTTFSIVLPIKKEAKKPAPQWEKDEVSNQTAAYQQIPLPSPADQLIDPNIGGDDKPLLLIIEDNTDVVEYLKSCLEDEYKLAVAGNGGEGIEKAIELVPDIIITDVMMPVKDGYEVCKTLRQDEKTSHIPIIMLTAKASIEDKLTGLERGADAYLVKPFNKKELFIRLRKLIELRQQLVSRYQNLEVPIPTPSTSHTKLEDEFLRKLRRIVEDHLDDAEFDITSLADEIAMSRSQLHRKLKALTGRSATQYVRGVRMHKAKHLLLHTNLPISEVGYAVGFNDPNYFSRSFLKEFEIRPSEVRNG